MNSKADVTHLINWLQDHKRIIQKVEDSLTITSTDAERRMRYSDEVMDILEAYHRGDLVEAKPVVNGPWPYQEAGRA